MITVNICHMAPHIDRDHERWLRLGRSGAAATIGES